MKLLRCYSVRYNCSHEIRCILVISLSLLKDLSLKTIYKHNCVDIILIALLQTTAINSPIYRCIFTFLSGRYDRACIRVNLRAKKEKKGKKIIEKRKETEKKKIVRPNCLKREFEYCA